MGFFRKDLVEFALDRDTRQAIDEQKAWIAAEPSNPLPYHQLALLCRMQGQQDEALGLLLQSVQLDPAFAPAHVALAEIYTVRKDLKAARRHAEIAADLGHTEAREMLRRHGL